MKRSTNRILTTHTGSLPRPPDLLELLQKRAEDTNAGHQFQERLPGAVAEIVRQQADAGIDIVSDGELGKLSFFHYVRDRLSGFEGVSDRPFNAGVAEEFPGYAAWRTR